jgi:hypothetical protein
MGQMSEGAHNRELLINFVGVNVAEANRLAEDLGNAIAESHKEVTVARRRGDDSAQDFGSTLTVLLAAPAAVAVAKGIQYWLMKHHSVRLTIVTKEKTTLVENLTSKDAVKFMEVLKGYVEE